MNLLHQIVRVSAGSAPAVQRNRAALVAAGSFLVLRRFGTPTYYLVPVGALAGIGWVLAGPG